MSRLTGFADLTGKTVGIFGYGMEGRASAARLREIAAKLVLVDDVPVLEGNVLLTSDGGHEALLKCDVVLKSPGIPRRRSDVLDLELHGVKVTSALNLWMHDVDRSRVIAVTGTKGKSTTTSLIAFFLEACGERALRLGNIGLPPYDPSVDSTTGWLVVEVSSFQCVDIDVAPRVVVLTSLGADHLDWHGSLEEYRADKLSLTRCEGAHHTLVPDVPIFHDVRDQLGGDVRFVKSDHTGVAASLGLLGSHSDSNVALAFEAVSTVTGLPVEEVREAVRNSATKFEPLRGRLTLVATEQRGGGVVRYVDDGLATSPLPTIAALEVFEHQPVALIAGGFDRGVDYAPLAAALAKRVEPTLLITMGEAGERIRQATKDVRADLPQVHAESMLQAVHFASEFLVGGGVALMSPGAPSFDRYRNWEERSNDFTRIARDASENYGRTC